MLAFAPVSSKPLLGVTVRAPVGWLPVLVTVKLCSVTLAYPSCAWKARVSGFTAMPHVLFTAAAEILPDVLL